MCCVWAALLFIGPRFGGALWWVLAPERWSLVWHGWLLPLVGLLLLPWTTISYTWVAVGGVHGFEWAVLVISLLLDLSSNGGSAYGRRRGSH